MDLGESDGGLPRTRSRNLTRSSPTRAGPLADGDLVGLAALHLAVQRPSRLMGNGRAPRPPRPAAAHSPETVEEDEYCRTLYGCTPVEYLERVGWIDGDVWCAHCVHLSDADVQTFGRAGVGVAH